MKTVDVALFAIGIVAGALGGLAIALLVMQSSDPPKPQTQSPPQIIHGVALIDAIIEVESGGDDSAVGQLDEIGALQIRPIMVREVNRILGKDAYSLDDRLDRRKSIEMFWIYSNHWAKVTGDRSDEGIARRWNGGPTGHEKRQTEAYWSKVSSLLWAAESEQ